MKKFVLHYHGPSDPTIHLGSADQKADIMKQWMIWKDDMGDNLIDFGAPLIGSIIIQKKDSETCRGTKISGYSIIQAIDIIDVKRLLENHPHLQLDADVSIEVFECSSM